MELNVNKKIKIITYKIMQNRAKPIVFTDLDGTLLDEENYSFEPALNAIEELKRLSVPIVLCSSKTKGEIEFYRDKIAINAPFIVENGGAIFIPDKYFSHKYSFDLSQNSYKIIKLGLNYSMLVSRLKELRKSLGIDIICLSELSAQEISKITRLRQQEALLSKQREYIEPFMLNQVNAREKELLFKEIKRCGLHITKGNIFYHLQGSNNKGKAVRRLMDIYKQAYSKIISIGLGDSLNDLPMLKSVDIPILIRKKDLSYNREIKDAIVDIHISSQAGPEGWNTAIFDCLKDYLKKPNS